jgi:APA family basic amino acid/polyamine antiporter
MTTPHATLPRPGEPPVGVLQDLPRTLGLWTAVAVVIGNIIGSGIFRVPASVAAQVESVSGIAVVWAAGGLISLCGALSLAELSAAYPRSGGVFVYLREAYGAGVAFLFGWTLLIIGPASSSAVALVFAEYLGTLVPLTPTGIRVIAGAAILVVGVAGYRSARGAGAIQSAATAGKVGALIALVATAFLLGDGDTGAFGGGASGAETRWAGVGLGLVAALWAYNGWQDVSYVAGEVRDPARTLPRALLLGTGLVVVIYLSANAAYLYVLPFPALRESPLVASDTVVRVVGAAGAGLVAAMVMVSTFGALNGTGLVNPRVFYAMARENLLFRSLARVHPRYGTPHVAIVFYTLLSLVFVSAQTFEQLAATYVLGLWPFLALAVAAVIVLRRRRADLERPFKTPGYPVLPIVFVIGTAFVVGSALVQQPASTLLGIALTLLGVPIYIGWRRMQRA